MLNDSHTEFIIELIRATSCDIYLELGIDDGLNISKIVPYCNKCIGVDIVDNRYHYGYEFHKMSSSDFLNQFKEKADIIFIDANHNFEYVKTDLLNALKVLNKYGIILIHDTDPSSLYYSSDKYCGDSYKIINWIKTCYSELNVVTLPIGVTGLTIVNRDKERRVYEYISAT